MPRGKSSSPHIGIFGRRNYGKSSLINCLAGQDIAIVSEVAGTTTDPVKKTMEIPGIGPVVLIDTAGIDDTGDLGKKRRGKSLETLKTIDLAILLIISNRLEAEELHIIEELRKLDVPFFILHNQADIAPLHPEMKQKLEKELGVSAIDFASTGKMNTGPVISLIRELIPESAYQSTGLVGDLISGGDTVLLITPIDSEAPEGRMILPQVQVIRDVLDQDGIAVVLKESELDVYIRRMQPLPKLVVTDSQAFQKVDASIPNDIWLTGFSILLARQRGDFENYLKGTPHISKLKDGDKILILESCTHQVSCDDIGRVKIPRWISDFTGKKLHFEIVAGLTKLPEDLPSFALVIQCGGCVITRKQVLNRLRQAVQAGVPVTNYGMAIAYVHGIYNRAIAPFLKGNQKEGDYI